jgi:hypothetical protein
VPGKANVDTDVMVFYCTLQYALDELGIVVVSCAIPVKPIRMRGLA